MIKYNRDKRGTYNARIRARAYDKYDAQDTQDKRARIHIPIHYDGYNRVEYMPIIYSKTRDTRARTYVNITNAIRDIFPEIDAPHTAHTYRATAPYRKYPQRDNTPYTRALKWYEQMIEESTREQTIYKDTRTVKCIILNDKNTPIYIGMMRRTRTVNRTQGTIHIMLHKGKRTLQAYERAVDPDKIIHNITVREIKAHDVEIYYI